MKKSIVKYRADVDWAKMWFTVSMVLALSFSFVDTAGSADARQIKLLTNNCIQCHTNPESSAPIMGVTEDWQAVIAQGEEATLKNVVLGIRGMPPLGYCSACNENDLRVLTQLIVGFPQKGKE